MYRTKLIILSTLCFCICANAKAQTCTPAPSCAELGFVNAIADCVGGDFIKCPFEQSKVFCRNTKSCESLGFDKTTGKCSGKKMFVCPTDATKVACDDSNMVGEIKLWSGKTLPRGWLKCEGQSKLSSDYRDLYAVIGTSFGGSGAYFNLPNFKGRVPVGVGYAISTAYTYSLGSKGGEDKHSLTISEMPSHNHGYTGSGGGGWPKSSGDRIGVGNPNSYVVQTKIDYQGGSYAHENRMPYLGIYYIIYTGVY